MDTDHKHRWTRDNVCVHCGKLVVEVIEEERERLQRILDYYRDRDPDVDWEVQKRIDRLPDIRWTTSEVIVR